MKDMHPFWFRVLLQICFIISSFKSGAQEKLPYQQFTTDQQLSENVVYCIAQDQRGFIWAGTHHGLNRYDGYGFKKYYAINEDSLSISDNSIQCIVADASNKFWIGTSGGLNYFDPITGINKRIQYPGQGIGYSVNDLVCLDQENLLVKKGNKIHLYNSKQNKWEQTDHSPFPFYKFYKLPNGKIGIGTMGGNGFLLYNPSLNKWENTSILDGFPAKITDFITNYFVDSRGNHYQFSMQNSFRILDGKGNLLASIDKKQLNEQFALEIYSFRESENNSTWITSNKGLFKFLHNEKKLVSIELTGDSRSLKGNKEIRCLLIDKDKDMWMGVFGEGILKSRIRKTPFSSIGLEEITANVYERMIFGLYQWKTGEIAAETGYQNFSVIVDNTVNGFVNARQMGLEKIINKTLGKSLTELSAVQKNLLERIYAKSNLWPMQFILPDSNTVILTTPVLSIYRDTNVRQIGGYTTNLYDDGKYLWAATLNGLLRVDKLTFSDTTYLNVPGNPFSINQNSLYSVIGDKNGNLWIGTKGGGLNFFNREEQKFYHYTTDHGLPDNVIYFILQDKGKLWLSTNNGLSLFHIADRSFQNFSKRDGLLNSEFNRNGGVLTKEGILYFSGTNGIDYFNPSDVQALKEMPVVYISEINVNGGEFSGDGNDLKHFENNITFSYTANEFTRPDLVYYRYKLKDDQTWTRVQGKNTVAYHGLPPGSYTFEVQSSYDNYNWSKTATYVFNIATPWWQSWLFYVLCAVAVAYGLWFFYHYRINQLKKIQLMRTRISQDLHDEVCATLSSIHVYSSVASKLINQDTVKAQDALRQINLNTRQVMENMNDIVWAMNNGNPDEISLESKLKNYGYELLTPLNIVCNYSIDKEAERKLQNIEARKNILLIAKEAINNIAKHSSATTASVQLQANAKELQLTICDNGIGIDLKNTKAGNGLRNMKQRAASMGGLLDFSNLTGGGNRIYCRIPLTNIRD